MLAPLFPRVAVASAMLAAVATFGLDLQAQVTPAADTGWTLAKPLTGRPVRCEKGRIKLLSCENIELLAYLPPSAMGGGPELAILPGVGGAGAFDIWGWIDSSTGREFALVGGSDATAFVEVTDPVNPKYLGRLPFHNGVQGLAGVKVYKNYAYIIVEGADAGLQIFDLTQLRNVKSSPVDFQETAHYDQFGNAHTITLNPESGFAYPTGIAFGAEPCSGALHMIDLREPTKPTFAGCYISSVEGTQYIHDAMCLIYRGPDEQYKGHEICLNSSSRAVIIVDVTDKKNVKTISVATYPNVAFTHQGWLTEDQRYFFLDDEADDGANGIDKTRTIVFDLKDLDDPVVLAEFHGTTDATDHNLYIRGRYMYQANYTAGLRVIDVADPKNPKEVGYLDTAPDLDGPGMTLGAWGSFPWFKNNVVALASRGLFLVRYKPK